MKKIIALFILLSAGSLSMANPISLGFTYGFAGVDNAVALSATGKYQWNNLITFKSGWAITGYWDTELNYFNTTESLNPKYTSFWMISETPNFRFIRETPYENGLSPFIDAGFGFGILTARQFSNNNLGGYASFRESIGVGTRFGDASQFEVAYHYVNLTNLDLLSKNDGFFINTIELDYYF